MHDPWTTLAPLPFDMQQQLHPYSNDHFYDAVTTKKPQDPSNPRLLHWVSLDLNYSSQLFLGAVLEKIKWAAKI